MDRKSVRELKDVLGARGVDFSGVVEREELERLYRESEQAEVRAEQQQQQHSPTDGGASSSTAKQASRRDPKTEGFLRYARAAETLGSTLTASDADLQAAQKKLLKQHHPDRNQQNPEAAERKFKETRAAYELLISLGYEKRVELMQQAQQLHAQRVARRLEDEQKAATAALQAPLQPPKKEKNKGRRRQKQAEDETEQTQCPLLCTCPRPDGLLDRPIGQTRCRL